MCELNYLWDGFEATRLTRKTMQRGRYARGNSELINKPLSAALLDGVGQ